MNIKDYLLSDIFESLSDLAIPFIYNKNGVFNFDNENDFKYAKEILEDKLGEFSVVPLKDHLNIKIFLEDLSDSFFKNLTSYLTENYFNKKLLTEETYKYKLNQIKEYLEDPETNMEEDNITDELIENDLVEDAIEETYDEEELKDLKNRTFNQQKILSIYRYKKYGDTRLYAHTRCIKCGREKKVFLSNLINDPEKYGSCVCSDTNIDARMDTITNLFKGTKKLSNNTSGYTGVSLIKKYRGKPYNKWRAYIEVDGKRTYLGDFTSKTKAVRARKAAAEKGLKWYRDNKNQFMAKTRAKQKRYKKNRK